MNDINEEEIRVFVTAIDRYFSQVTSEKATVRGAYLNQNDAVPPNYGFTGLITMSGEYHGCIYFSAPRAMVRHVLIAMQESDHSNENLLDAVGEVANTIAGNARKYFGETMEISVPITILGEPTSIRAPVRARPYVIAIDWRNYAASLVIDIERKSRG